MSKKVGIIFTLILFLITGCHSNSQDDITSTSIDEKNYDTKNFQYITCSRDTETSDDSEVEIQYEIYYNDDQYIEILKSSERVTSTNQETLEKYKEAYEQVYSVYDGLKYYDNEVTKDDNSVTSITYINYGKIDMNKLMDIEGTEDNVAVTDGKIKLDDWKSFAKKYGTQCSSES